MAANRIPGPTCPSLRGPLMEDGTLRHGRSQRPGPQLAVPRTAPHVVQVRRRPGRPHRPPADPGVIFIGLGFILVNPIHTDHWAQLAVANEVFATCRVQFYVEETFDVDPVMGWSVIGPDRTVEGDW